MIWTKEEDTLFVVLLEKYGGSPEGLINIAKNIPTRTLKQVIRHYNDHTANKQAGAWSLDEDKKLINAVLEQRRTNEKEDLDMIGLKVTTRGKQQIRTRLRYLISKGQIPLSAAPGACSPSCCFAVTNNYDLSSWDDDIAMMNELKEKYNI